MHVDQLLMTMAMTMTTWLAVFPDPGTLIVLVNIHIHSNICVFAPKSE